MSTSLAFTLYSLFLIVGLLVEVGVGKYLFLLLFPLLGTLIIIPALHSHLGHGRHNLLAYSKFVYIIK